MDILSQIKPNPLIVENKWCFNLFDTFHLQAIPFDNEKGYAFISHPCFCYSSLLKDIHTKHSAIGTPMEVFKSDKIRSFYQKIVEQRDFSYCKGCPKYESRQYEGFATAYQLCVYFGLGFAHDLDYQYRKRKLAEQPLTYKVALNLDSACNLHCQTCRDELITKTFNMTDEDIAECIEIAKKSPYLILGADGELFISPNYKRILQSDLSESEIHNIELYSNGTIFTEKRWMEYVNPKNERLIKKVKISLDAACEETYQKVRGNHWKPLMENLKFIVELKKRLGFQLHTTFTISKLNVSDVKSFTDFAYTLGFDAVQYSFAREQFHPGKEPSSFIITEDQTGDIKAYLRDLGRQDFNLILDF